MYVKMVENDTSKYPARMGKKWEQEEVQKLLASIKEKKPVSEIATEHERTDGGIYAELRKLAADYWFKDKKPMEEIIGLTGLPKEDIELAIKRREAAIEAKAIRKEAVIEARTIRKEAKLKVVKSSTPTTSVSVPSHEIAELRNEVASLKRDVKEMLRLMNALYEFESA
jgi:hypothetical protein